MADAYDAYVADLHGRPLTLTRDDFFRIYGDQLGRPVNPTAFLQGSINFGQYGNVSSIAPDPFTGQVITQRNPMAVPLPTMDQFGEIARENEFQGRAMNGYYSPPTPLPPTMLYSSAVGNVDLALTRSATAGYDPTGGSQGYNVANLQQTNSLEGARAIAGQLGVIGCNQISNPQLRAACIAIATAVTVGGMMNGNGAPSGGGMMQNGGGGVTGLVGPCMPPLMMGPNGCFNPNSPAGADAFGTEVALGIFGIPSAAPRQVGSYGMGRPILRCGRGLVLGKDNRCYAKGSIPRSARKWAPEPRPLVSRSDVKALARIKSIKGRVKKAASSAGLSCSTKGGARKLTSKKK